jgi:hypothetical protein
MTEMSAEGRGSVEGSMSAIIQVFGSANLAPWELALKQDVYHTYVRVPFVGNRKSLDGLQM